MAANTSDIAQCSRKAVWSSKMQEQKSLMLHWRLFLRECSDVEASMFGLTAGQWSDYVSQWPCLLMNYQTHKTKNRWRIVDPHFHDCSSSVSQSFSPIETTNPITWKDLTMEPFVWQKCETKNCWHSVDAQLNDILTVSGCPTTVCENEYSRDWQPINRFYV